MADIDYRALLVRYIRHIIESEGVDMITAGGMDYEQILSEADKIELEKLALEARENNS